MMITPMMFCVSPSGPSRLLGTLCTMISDAVLPFASWAAAASGRLNSDQVPGRITFATTMPMTIAIVVLSSNRPASRPADLPEIWRGHEHMRNGHRESAAAPARRAAAESPCWEFRK